MTTFQSSSCFFCHTSTSSFFIFCMVAAQCRVHWKIGSWITSFFFFFWCVCVCVCSWQHNGAAVETVTGPLVQWSLSPGLYLIYLALLHNRPVERRHFVVYFAGNGAWTGKGGNKSISSLISFFKDPCYFCSVLLNRTTAAIIVMQVLNVDPQFQVKDLTSGKESDKMVAFYWPYTEQSRGQVQATVPPRPWSRVHRRL